MMQKAWIQKIIFLMLILAGVTAFFILDGAQYLSLDLLKKSRESLQDYYLNNPLLVITMYFIVYVVVTSLSLPGATVLTLAGGAILGFWAGLLTVSFASVTGASFAFLAARVLLGNWVQHRYAGLLQKVNDGVEKDGAVYLLFLRLVPLFPFFLVNLLMGLTKIRLSVYYVASQIGMLPATAVYVNAGHQLATINSVKEILSFRIISALVLLGILPFVMKGLWAILKKKRPTMKSKR